jgi:hypothetical protein
MTTDCLAAYCFWLIEKPSPRVSSGLVLPREKRDQSCGVMPLNIRRSLFNSYGVRTGIGLSACQNRLQLVGEA